MSECYSRTIVHTSRMLGYARNMQKCNLVTSVTEVTKDQNVPRPK